MLRAGSALLALVVPLAAAPVRAEQFVLADVSYTHSAQTTQDSHYYPDLPADMPKDWTKPVDYAHGSVHVVLDVKTKPAGDAPTKFQLCFEGTPSYGCTLQSPTYTKTGRVEWDSPFSSFWYESTVDWAQGVKRMPLILKDDMNNKPAGDPKYVPSELHVQVTLVSAGAKFVAPPPPTAAGSGGGGAGGAGVRTGGTGGSRAGAGGAAGGREETGGAGKPSGGAGGSARDARAGTGAAAVGGAGGSVAAAVGGRGGSGDSQTSSQSAAGGKSVVTQDSAGCSSAGGGSAPWGSLLALGWLVWRRRARVLRAGVAR
jgi:uncharacterized protein (TIGR03382 family)